MKIYKKTLLILSVIFLIIISGCNNKPNITDFEQCVEAGNPVMESYPRQCKTDGMTFVENISNDLKFQCESKSGIWIGSANECEGISKQDCDILGGAFNECASACRNNPDAQICTLQCVLLC